MGSFIKQIRYVAVVVLCAVVFTLVTNCWNNDQARKWQVDSEDLIWGRIIQMQLGEKDTGFLGRYGASQKNGYLRDCFREGEIPQGEWNSYTHQSGLQGTLFGFVNLIFESFSLGGKSAGRPCASAILFCMFRRCSCCADGYGKSRGFWRL